MAKKPPTSGNSGLNFRPSMERTEPKGMKPLPEPTTVYTVLLFMLQHLCRKVLFINTFYRIVYYMSVIFLISIVVDLIPAPKISVTRKENFFNQYFVKVGWGWTLLILIPFVSTTSFVYCCGRRNKVLEHVLRLGIATIFWLFWTSMFNYIESIYGRCNVRDEKLQTKHACLGKGFFWQSIDISGHCFLLIYSTLVIIEEGRVINSWEGISDFIRDEEFARSSAEENTGYRLNPLKSLDTMDFDILKNAFPKITPYIRILFIFMTILSIIWELMLLGTIFYYHSMLEKFLAGLTAICTWYFTYYMWYPRIGIPPCQPGEGSFKYKDIKGRDSGPKRRQTLTRLNQGQGPRFMGMPINVRRPLDERQDETSNNT